MFKKNFIVAVVCAVGIQSVEAGSVGDAYNMGGFYAGIGVGEATILINEAFSSTFDAYNMATNGVTNDTRTGILFQGQIGYGKMFEEHTYLGLKGSVYYTPIHYSGTGSEQSIVDGAIVSINDKVQMDFKPIFNIDGVFGYEIYPHVIPFVQAGVSFAGVTALNIQKNSGFNQDTGGRKLFSQISRVNNKYETGYNVGFGTTYQSTKHFLLSGEVIYNYIGKFSSSDTTFVNTHLQNHTISSDLLLQQVSLFITASYLVPGS
ncbi:MAG: hypothetical protein P1U61_03455 [Legionellaceae bacterium]|nr:hypothetical protein [Legionellaceae bacterium]